MNDILTQKKVKQHLEAFEYLEYFNSVVLDGKSPYFDGKEIDFGDRRGQLFKKGQSNQGILDAANLYLDLYPMVPLRKNNHDKADYLKKGKKRIETWRETFKSLNDENELLVTTIDILDWGNVWSSNIADVIEIFRGENSEIKSLKSYFNSIADYVKEPKLIREEDNIDIHFSSGWTKVYSFLYDSMVIYDSRVSAFLNYTLLMALKTYCENNRSNEEKKNAIRGFEKIASNLFNFGGSGNNGNLRKFSFKRKSGLFKSEPNKKDAQGFNANVIATWIFLEIWSKIPSEIKNGINDEFGNENGIRILERAFFLFGFDLSKFKDNNGNSMQSKYFETTIESLQNLI